MDLKSLTIAAAVGGLLAATPALAGDAAAQGEKVKCYGIAKAGQNDCATTAHSCAGSSKVDKDPKEWKYAPRAECEKAGGKAVVDDKKGM